MEKETKVKKTSVKKNTWVIKDRLYELDLQIVPPVYILKSRNLYWFDKEKGYEREIKYCRNQQTVFVDEMKGPQRLGHIVFRNGQLFVEKEKSILQKFLSLYHPLSGKTFNEYNAEQEAAEDIDILDMQLEAMNAAKAISVDKAEAIMRTEIGNEVSSMTSKELKRDLMIFARNNPELFLDLASDTNIDIRNMGIKAVEQGLITLSGDNRTFKWASNDRKLMDVPFDENPYSALASWFKTDDGVEVFKSVEKQLK